MDFLYKYKKIVIICLAVLSLMLMAYTALDRYQPGPVERGFGFVVTNVQGFFMNIGDWFSDRFDFLVNMNTLHNENQRLQEQILMYQIENARLTHVDEENRVLTELLDINRRYSDYPTKGANIIAQDPTNWMDTFTINLGQRDGLAVDMVVLAPGGLAGRVSKVGGNYAIVTSIVEDTSAVAAQSHRTGDWGVVHGDINLSSTGLLRMEHISLESDITIGDEIVTSNISSIYPPGIHIGYVVSMGQMPNNMRYALVRPSVDFSRLTTVSVVTELFTHEPIGIEEY
ncbi:MAG: rod shape-determining protein MreC [Defluviitaleaceae bacterium]|nr:rod shape-determining protein MreC [Defluviitaleaceae bacterium]